MPKPKREPAENTDVPRFIALCGDEYVDADDDLDELLRVLAELVDPNEPEDVAVWCGHRIAGIVRSDGTIHRFDFDTAHRFDFDTAPPTPKPTQKPAKRTRRPP